MVEKYCNVKFCVMQAQDLKVIRCIGSAKFVNELLVSDHQSVHRLLFGFVLSGLLFNLTQPHNINNGETVQSKGAI